jgi:hypothetical protein
MPEYQLPPSHRIAACMLEWLLPSDLRFQPEYDVQERAGCGMPEYEPEPMPRPPTRIEVALAPTGPHEHHYGFSRRGLVCQHCLVPYQVVRRQLAQGR